MNSKIILLISFLFTTIIGYAQEIMFTQAANWEQVKTLAQQLGKNIFVDCYATWCGPCKKMDREVFNNSEVISFFNANYVSIKIQMDKTEIDTDRIKSWYKDADSIRDEYAIDAFPSFLFFSADGKLLHRGSGFLPPNDLIQVGKSASDPAFNVVVLEERFESGKLTGDEMREFALHLNKVKIKELANRVARKYKSDFLDLADMESLFSSENITFIKAFPALVVSDDQYFEYFLECPGMMDSLFKRKGVSERMVKFVITNEEINEKLYKNDKPFDVIPDWNGLETYISGKYSEQIAADIILDSKLRWYATKEDWPKIVEYSIERVERDGIGNSDIQRASLNNMIYTVIFKHSQDPVALQKGIDWMELILDSDPGRTSWIDTYANLLYKLGETRRAIDQMERAVAILEEKKKSGIIHSSQLKELTDLYTTIGRMRSGEKTWE